MLVCSEIWVQFDQICSYLRHIYLLCLIFYNFHDLMPIIWYLPFYVSLFFCFEIYRTHHAFSKDIKQCHHICSMDNRQCHHYVIVDKRRIPYGNALSPIFCKRFQVGFHTPMFSKLCISLFFFSKCLWIHYSCLTVNFKILKVVKGLFLFILKR